MSKPPKKPSFVVNAISRCHAAYRRLHSRVGAKGQSLSNDIHSRVGEADKQIGEINSRIEGYKKKSIVVLVMGLITFVLLSNDVFEVFLKFQPTQIDPMPLGAPNIIVAGIGVNHDGEILGERESAEAMGQRIYELLLPSNPNGHLRKFGEYGIGYITGETAEARQEQARQIAETHRASVVLYGTIRELDNRQAIYYPEFYVHENRIESEVILYGREITDVTQFGSGIRYDMSDWEDKAHDDVTLRIDRLNYFIRGLQKYINGDATSYKSAKTSFCAALGVKSTESCATNVGEQRINPSSADAVIYLFLGATAVKERNLEEAFAYSARAHAAWPEYPRPYLTRGSLLYQHGMEQLRAHTNKQYIRQSTPTTQQCFSKDIPVALSAIEYLDLARQCYNESAVAAQQISEIERSNHMHVDLKATFSLATILQVQTLLGINEQWLESELLLDQVIVYYETHKNNRQEVLAISELVANAYARRAVARHCRVDRSCLTKKINTEMRPDSFVAADLKLATGLLIDSNQSTKIICKITQDYIPVYMKVIRSECSP